MTERPGNEPVFRAPAGNDAWVADVLGGLEGGYFVEAGAMYGGEESSSLALERYYGWTGLLVEPDPTGWEQLQRAGRRAAIERVVLLDREGDCVFRKATTIGYSGVEAYLHRGKSEHWGGGETLELPCTTLSRLLEKHGAPPTIYFLGLDTEGSELPILRGLDMERYRPLLISIEDASCDEYLLARGYVRVRNPHCPPEIDWEHFFVHEPIAATSAVEGMRWRD